MAASAAAEALRETAQTRRKRKIDRPSDDRDEDNGGERKTARQNDHATFTLPASPTTAIPSIRSDTAPAAPVINTEQDTRSNAEMDEKEDGDSSSSPGLHAPTITRLQVGVVGASAAAAPQSTQGRGASSLMDRKYGVETSPLRRIPDSGSLPPVPPADAPIPHQRSPNVPTTTSSSVATSAGGAAAAAPTATDGAPAGAASKPLFETDRPHHVARPYQKVHRLELNPDQRVIVEYATDAFRRSFWIVGEGGAGKTRALIGIFNKLQKETPTRKVLFINGRAAQCHALPGTTTAERLLNREAPFSDGLTHDESVNVALIAITKNPVLCAGLASIEALLVDDMHYISLREWQLLDRVFRTVRRGDSEGTAFGNLQVIATADPYAAGCSVEEHFLSPRSGSSTWSRVFSIGASVLNPNAFPYVFGSARYRDLCVTEMRARRSQPVPVGDEHAMNMRFGEPEYSMRLRVLRALRRGDPSFYKALDRLFEMGTDPTSGSPASIDGGEHKITDTSWGEVLLRSQDTDVPLVLRPHLSWAPTTKDVRRNHPWPPVYICDSVADAATTGARLAEVHKRAHGDLWSVSLHFEISGDTNQAPMFCAQALRMSPPIYNFIKISIGMPVMFIAGPENREYNCGDYGVIQSFHPLRRTIVVGLVLWSTRSKQWMMKSNVDVHDIEWEYRSPTDPLSATARVRGLPFVPADAIPLSQLTCLRAPCVIVDCDPKAHRDHEKGQRLGATATRDAFSSRSRHVAYSPAFRPGSIYTLFSQMHPATQVWLVGAADKVKACLKANTVIGALSENHVPTRQEAYLRSIVMQPDRNHPSGDTTPVAHAMGPGPGVDQGRGGATEEKEGEEEQEPEDDADAYGDAL